MKILHTSDWHLGVSLEHATREPEHHQFLDWLLNTMHEQSVEVLIIAGDIFHHSQPSASAQADYYGFLTKCIQLPALRKIIAVGGNHDSASRLDAPREILDALKIHTVGGLLANPESWQRCLCPIRNPETNNVEAVIAAVPFVQEARLGILTTQYSEIEINERYEAGFKTLYTHLADLAAERYGSDIPLIATGHLTCTDETATWQKKSGDFNSDIHQVGTIGALSTSIFDERYDYVALGHIHHCRQLGSRNIWYSGTPVATRPEESTSARKILLVNLENQSNPSVTPITVPTWRPILSLEGTPDEIFNQLRTLSTSPDTKYNPYLYINLIVDTYSHLNLSHFDDFIQANTPPDQHPPQIVDLRQTLSEQARLETPPQGSQHPSLQELTPEETFTLLYRLQKKSDPDDETLIAFRSLLTDDGQADLHQLKAVHKEQA